MDHGIPQIPAAILSLLELLGGRLAHVPRAADVEDEARGDEAHGRRLAKGLAHRRSVVRSVSDTTRSPGKPEGMMKSTRHTRLILQF